MIKTAKSQTRVTRADRTRSEILSAAEYLIANNGFTETRLEDVADEVGLTKAALFYHFKDKQTLYDAMIANAFGWLDQVLHDLLDKTDSSITERLELAVEAWVDAITERPTLGRLILRFVADNSEESVKNIYSDDQLVPLKFFSLFEEGRKTGVLNPQYEDPFHIASAVIGTTVFYASALSTLIPAGRSAPVPIENLKQHKKDALRLARHLLGIQ